MIKLDRGNPNTFIGVILLVVLAVFVLPDRLPQFISELSPYLFGGIPCGRLPAAKDLAAHQSIIGRSAADPLLLEIAASEIDADDKLVLRLSVTNRSLGTVPLVYQEDNISLAAADDFNGRLRDSSSIRRRPTAQKNGPIPTPKRMKKRISACWVRGRNVCIRQS